MERLDVPECVCEICVGVLVENILFCVICYLIYQWILLWEVAYTKFSDLLVNTEEYKPTNSEAGYSRDETSEQSASIRKIKLFYN